MVTGGFSSSGRGVFSPLLSVLVYFNTPATERGHISELSSLWALRQPPMAGQGTAQQGRCSAPAVWNHSSSFPFDNKFHKAFLVYLLF